jgi:NitT/TauT family transport system permease protein
VIAWAEKFKVEQVESAEVPHSWVLNLLQHSRALAQLEQKAIFPLRESLMSYFSRRHNAVTTTAVAPRWKTYVLGILGVAALGLTGYAVVRVAILLTGLDHSEVTELGQGLGATFLRVIAALLIGAAWTIPVGVKIGFSPRLARVAQPLAQIAASVPANAFFPVILLILLRLGSGLGIGSILLLLLGTQWYILFNVIAGAMAIPTDLKEACTVCGIRGWQRWRKLILPGIFPYLLTGMVTASGGAWNASIVAEYFHFKGQTFSTIGLGSTISRATDSGNYDLLIAATIVMAAMVVTVNRLLWRRLYRLGETRFRLES